MTALGVFAAAFLAYAACLYPSFAPRDAADMARAALTAGVAHPPGYPLYALLGRLWTALLPFGGGHYRLNLMSAFFAALACALLAAWAARRGRWAGWTAGLALAFCAPLWKFALLEEKYALQAAFLAALILLSDGGARAARLSGLLLGLGLVNHQTLLFSVPALLLLWRGRPFVRHAWPWALAGLALNLAVPIRLHDWSLGWAVLTRAEYGALTLFGGLAKPLALAAPGLLLHFLLGIGPLWLGLTSLPVAAGALFTGPVFFLLTRMDVSGWVGRSILEPAFIQPAVWLSAGAGLLAARLGGRGAAVCGLLLAFGLARPPRHRDDFSAQDYARALKRTLPPGEPVVVQGDTALFALKLDESRPVVSSLEREWGQPRWAVGLPLARVPGRPAAAGLALRLDGRSQPDAWSFYAIRRGRALRERESYARDALLSYAFARHNAALLAERSGADGTLDAVWAAIWEPEDFDVELSR